MADISMLTRMLNGLPRDVEIAANTLVTTSIKVGGGVSNTELTKAILDRLVALQNGSDVDATYHTHDGRYFTESELGSSSASSGTDLIGDDDTYANFTPSAATLKGALSGIDAALATAGGTAFSDALFRIEDNGDDTKKIAFEASAITTATTRTITMPDANVDLGLVATAIQRDGSVSFTADQPMNSFKLVGLAAGSAAGHSVRYEQAILVSGANAFAANQSLGGFKITNAADGTSAQDYVTKAQLDAFAAGLDPKASVRAATTAALPAVTYNNGASGVGATLTADANGALASQDGVSLIVGNRLLVKNQAAALQNGIYTVTDLGSGGTPFILTRATDQDGSPVNEVSGGNFTFVEAGTANVGAGYSILWDGNIVLGTDPVNWSQFSSTAVVGGDMITVTGNSVAVDLATTSGLESSNPGNAAGQLRVKLEASNPTLEINGSNELKVKYAAGSALSQGAGGLAVLVDDSTIEISTSLRIKNAGVTLAKLASDSVDENKIVSTTMSSSGAITGGSGTKLAVAVDGSSIEINTNALRIKSTAYDQATITGGGGSAAAVQNAPVLQETMIAGESFAANRSFLVRMALSAETAGRIYKADKAAGPAGSETNTIYVIGLAQNKTGSAITAGNPIPVVKWGNAVLQSSDTAFTASQDEGLPVYLGPSGGFTLTPSVTTNDAIVKVGTVRNVDASSAIEMSAPQIMGIVG